MEFLGEKGAYITGWLFFLDWSTTVMADITAVALYFHYWQAFKGVPQWVLALCALAAVFAALGVLPLVTLGQLGLIVGIGVLVDTLVVRTVIVPAIFGLAGDRIWWPGKLHAYQGESTHESRASSIDVH